MGVCLYAGSVKFQCLESFCQAFAHYCLKLVTRIKVTVGNICFYVPVKDLGFIAGAKVQVVRMVMKMMNAGQSFTSLLPLTF